MSDDVQKMERLDDLCGFGLWRRMEPHGGYSYWTDDIVAGRCLFDEGIDDWRMLLALARRLGIVADYKETENGSE